MEGEFEVFLQWSTIQHNILFVISYQHFNGKYEVNESMSVANV